MARPLSEEKRNSILTAATEMVARYGVGASTAKIANASGLGEGTLFTYFKTKDHLLNEVLFAAEKHLAGAVRAACSASGDPRSSVEEIWNALVEWGVAYPIARSAMRQLHVSDRISDENRRSCKTLFQEAGEVVEMTLADRTDPARVRFYIDTVLMGLADLTIEAITSSPQDEDHLKRAGFDLFWKGVAA